MASELPVVYPGQPTFAPDILAVLDVDDPGELDRRMAWSVADEGRGIDFVLEVLHGADPKKDLVGNVHFYAKLGIHEYFVYDRRVERVIGYRLAPGGIYATLPQSLGRVPSQVLDLDLAVVDGRLRFYHGMGELADSRKLIQQLNVLVRGVEQRAEDSAQRVDRMTQVLRTSLMAILAQHGRLLTDGEREHIEECADSDQLGQWLARAIAGDAPSELFRKHA